MTHRIIGSDIIRKYGLDGVGMALLEEVCLSYFLLPASLGVELSAPSPEPCLPACHHVHAIVIMD